MKKIFFSLFVALFLISGFSYGQSEKDNLILTGNLYRDSKIVLNKFDQENMFAAYQMSGKKSPVKAALFSLVVPGAGQFYNGNILLSAIFIAAEAVFITTAVIYNNKGNRQTDDFQNFADQHWSINRYAGWTLDHLSNLNSSLPHDETYYENRVFPNGRSGEVVLSELNNLERDIEDGYSHNLPPHGEQQYYELIGKYPQYSSGWDDFTGNDYHNLSPNFLNYSGQRGEANDLYRISTRAVAGIYINHVISALEAAWGASRFNDNLSVNMRLRTINLTNRVEYVPTMNISFSF